MNNKIKDLIIIVLIIISSLLIFLTFFSSMFDKLYFMVGIMFITLPFYFLLISFMLFYIKRKEIFYLFLSISSILVFVPSTYNYLFNTNVAKFEEFLFESLLGNIFVTIIIVSLLFSIINLLLFLMQKKSLYKYKEFSLDDNENESETPQNNNEMVIKNNQTDKKTANNEDIEDSEAKANILNSKNDLKNINKKDYDNIEYLEPELVNNIESEDEIVAKEQKENSNDKFSNEEINYLNNIDKSKEKNKEEIKVKSFKEEYRDNDLIKNLDYSTDYNVSENEDKFEKSKTDNNTDSNSDSDKIEIAYDEEVEEVKEVDEEKEYEYEQIDLDKKTNGSDEILKYEFIDQVFDDDIEVETYNEEDMDNKADLIIKTLSDFKIPAELIGYHRGPVVTRYEILVDEKVNLTKIEKLQKNITYNLSAEKIRILAPIPGKKAIGFEVPNEVKETVRFEKIVKSSKYINSKFQLPLILGKNIDGVDIIEDFTKMPHMLIAGRTGSGKSVCINTIISSLISIKSPDELKLILIDPKRVELSLYDDLPHLMTPVIVYPDEAASCLKWLVMEMEDRYRKLKDKKVRDIISYNKVSDEKMPYLVLIIDEFYALMQVAQKEIEDSLIRLSAMARAVGIHLLFATQRPSSDVVTGVIKSNLPSRISFQTASKTDSRIILDINGAESLLGNGDMLYSRGGLPPVRIQGAYIDTKQVKHLVNEISKQYPHEEFINIFEQIQEQVAQDVADEDKDPLYNDAIQIVKSDKKVSASYLQRRLKIGYNRAARIVETMEEEGLIGPINGNKSRDIYI